MTERTEVDARPVAVEAAARGFALRVLEGEPAGATLACDGGAATAGSHPSNGLVVSDAKVSRFHFEVHPGPDGPRLKDLSSTNGTTVDGVRVFDALLRDGSLIRCGDTTVRLELAAAPLALALHADDSFGELVGPSVAMRAVFARLAKIASSRATVLLTGETGTGKELAAEAIHRASDRAEGPFVVLDVGALPASLVEAELYGHEKGAFTGAVASRAGAFEEARGGTIFLDEIGELPLELQPKLLRVLERGTVRRLGGGAPVEVDVRVIAATNRDLRAEVNEGRFRPDLYYRLAVLSARMPSLRERPEDLAPLVERLLERLGLDETERARAITPAFLAQLRRRAWPGNVRELRNYVESFVVMDEAPGAEPTAELPVEPQIPLDRSYAEARAIAIERFERAWVPALIAHHQGNVTEAARAAKVDRAYLHRLLRRHRGRGAE